MFCVLRGSLNLNLYGAVLWAVCVCVLMTVFLLFHFSDKICFLLSHCHVTFSVISDIWILFSSCFVPGIRKCLLPVNTTHIFSLSYFIFVIFNFKNKLSSHENVLWADLIKSAEIFMSAFPFLAELCVFLSEVLSQSVELDHNGRCSYLNVCWIII